LGTQRNNHTKARSFGGISTPNPIGKSYYLITGGKGVGKTTAIKSSLSQLSSGFVYVAVDANDPRAIWSHLNAAFNHNYGDLIVDSK
jgi:predicted ABC-type ATPase